MNYENLNIYEATYEEVKEAVKNQYKNKEWTGYDGEVLTVKDWKQINSNIRDDLKEMGVRCKGAFYNPNNMRVYIKQSSRKVKCCGDILIMNSSDDYCFATGTDYYSEEDYFTVPAW